MASKYYNSSGKEVFDLEIAQADDLNSINTSVDTGFQGVESDIAAINGQAEYWAGISEKWAENPVDVEVEAGKYSSLHWSTKSGESAAASAVSEFNAAARAAAALVSEGNAASSETNAATSANTASDAAIAAGLYKDTAELARDKAEEWAENPEDVPVEIGQFSSLHWAAKAEAYAISIGDPVLSVTGTTNRIDVDNTDPQNPIIDISSSFQSGGQVDSVVGTVDEIDVDATDPANPIVSISPNFGGGGGGLDWSSPVQTADFVAEVGKGYAIDTTGGSVTMTMPTLAAGAQVAYKDYLGSFSTYALTVDAGSTLIDSTGDTSMTVNGRGSGGTLTGIDVTVGWLVTDHTPFETVQTKPFMHVQDQKPAGTSGAGTNLVGENIRELNTVLTNDIAGASLSANEVVLPAGEYYVDIRVPAYSTDRTTAYLKDSGGNILLLGSPCRLFVEGINEWSNITGKINLTSQTSIHISHYMEVATTTFGLGNCGYQLADTPIAMTDLKVWRLDIDKVYPNLSDPTIALTKPLFQIQHQEPSGTGGGASTVDVWHTRTLNTVITNEIAGASLAGNQFTLPAGTYELDAFDAVGGNMSSWKCRVWNVTDNVLAIDGYSLTSYDSGGFSGRLVLTETKTFKVEHIVSIGAGNAFGSPRSQGTEVYANLKIHQVDAVAQVPVVHQPINQPVTGAYVTGGIYGGELEYVSTTQFKVKAVSCMADDLIQELVLPIDTTHSIAGPTINTIYNVFVVRNNDTTISIMYDTDVNGANLTGITAKRWLGFVLTDASGDIVEFLMKGDTYHFKQSQRVLSGVALVFIEVVYTDFLPASRCETVALAPHDDASLLALSYDGIESVMGSGSGTTPGSLGVQYAVAGATIYAKTNSGTVNVGTIGAILRR